MIRCEEVHTKIYCPVRTRQTIMRIIFYATDKREVEFVDEPGVYQLGELCIDIGNFIIYSIIFYRKTILISGRQNSESDTPIWIDSHLRNCH